MRSLRLTFTGENPLLYSGSGFIDAIIKFLSRLPPNTLQSLDLCEYFTFFYKNLLTFKHVLNEKISRSSSFFVESA